METQASISTAQPNQTIAFFSQLIDEMKRHPLITAGFMLTVIAVIVLVLIEYNALGGQNIRFNHAMLGSLVSFSTTALGACGVLLLRGLSTKIEDSMLGFAAGMMMAASVFSLIIPALDASTEILGKPALSPFIVVIGLAMGVMLMLGLDRFTPHAHAHSGTFGPGRDRLSGVWLFTMAITLHNLPEGMAIGVGYAGGDDTVGLAITSAISIQNIPEGLAVAMALRAAGIRPLLALIVAAGSGLMEPIGAFIGVGVASGLPLAYPLGLSLAAGAMLFVVSHEVIPETHRNGHQTPATIGLMGGFAVMMVLDTALG
ncbi:MAG: ZIP family metal transporter [Neptunomonas phycophila]|uniref:ZIP family metal transporter n=1 Tax=Neptunomonas phycophila TaxID=1572645 RepID=UPI003B8E3116